MTTPPWSEPKATALLVLADGTIVEGSGAGAIGKAAGEVCFNTAMTGYQEILTDPSYAGQIVTFTFPHIGNVGANDDDIETLNAAGSAACGCVLKADISEPANWRAARNFDEWLKARGIVGISGVDTRALTARIREQGMLNGIIVHDPDGAFDIAALKAEAAALPDMAGLDLVPTVTSAQSSTWDETTWHLERGYGQRDSTPAFRVVALDYGVKRNILRLLADQGCEVTVLPATASADDVLSQKPDGVFLSNGPGDPAATGRASLPTIKAVVDSGVPTFGICLGHQMLGLAIGGKTTKMRQGHHGANHPVKDHTTGKVEIVSMNHGFALDRDSLPGNVEETHVSLFDGSNCGIRLTDKPVFSVQYHPEASPGPQDSHYLFKRFVGLMEEQKAAG